MNSASIQEDIAAIVEGWDQGSLGKFADVTMGQSPPSSHVSEGEDGIPFLQGNAEFSRRHPLSKLSVSRAFRTVPKDDILMSVRAPVGDLNLADKTYCIGRGLCGIRFVRKIEQPFGWYLVHYTRSQLNRLAQGSTFEAVGRQEVESIDLVYPTDTAEQSTIAEVLSTCDDTIEQTEAIIAKYERIKQGLMQDLLTKGIDENGNIRSEKTHKFKNSPLGRIPVEWSIRKIGEMASVKGRIGWRGYTYNDLRDSGPLVIGATQISTKHRIDLSQPVYLSKEKYLESPEIMVETGDVILVKTGNSIGKVAHVVEDIGEACINPNTALLKKITVNARFLYYTLISAENQQQIWDFVAAGAQPAVNQNNIKSMQTKMPFEPSEQAEIASRLSTLDEMIINEEQVMTKLQAIKRGLMQNLLSGVVRVTPLMQKD